jgi:5'-nucleotidase
MRVLLTNDDGIRARGLQTLRRALVELADVELAVVAPDQNQSATARSITTRRPLWVEEIDFGDGAVGYATDGTPVDCVRVATLGLIDGFRPDLIVSGINHGANLGDDITYSGTVAAALEGAVLGVPAIAVSQQSTKREMDFRFGKTFEFEVAAAFAARLVAGLDDRPISAGTLLNVNCPALTMDELAGAVLTRLGKRVYRDKLELQEEDESGRRRKRYSIYGMEPTYRQEEGTDFAAIDAGRISVTPLHFELTNVEALEEMAGWDLDALTREAAAVAPDSAKE